MHWHHISGLLCATWPQTTSAKVFCYREILYPQLPKFGVYISGIDKARALFATLHHAHIVDSEMHLTNEAMPNTVDRQLPYEIGH